MASNEKRKQSLYFADEILGEIMKEANRLDRSLSWVVQRAWRIAAREVNKFPVADTRALAPEEAARAAAGWGAAASGAEPERRPVLNGQADPRVRDFLRGKFDHTPPSLHE